MIQVALIEGRSGKTIILFYFISPTPFELIQAREEFNKKHSGFMSSHHKFSEGALYLCIAS